MARSRFKQLEGSQEPSHGLAAHTTGPQPPTAFPLPPRRRPAANSTCRRSRLARSEPSRTAGWSASHARPKPPNPSRFQRLCTALSLLPALCHVPCLVCVIYQPTGHRTELYQALHYALRWGGKVGGKPVPRACGTCKHVHHRAVWRGQSAADDSCTPPAPVHAVLQGGWGGVEPAAERGGAAVGGRADLAGRDSSTGVSTLPPLARCPSCCPQTLPGAISKPNRKVVGGEQRSKDMKPEVESRGRA